MKRVFVLLVIMVMLSSCAVLQNSTLQGASQQSGGNAVFDTSSAPVVFTVPPGTTGPWVIEFQVVPEGPYQKVEKVYFSAVDASSVIDINPPNSTLQFKVTRGNHMFNVKWHNIPDWMIRNDVVKQKDGHCAMYGKLQARIVEDDDPQDFQDFTSSDTKFIYDNWNIEVVVQ